jgi:hypothetical protein
MFQLELLFCSIVTNQEDLFTCCCRICCVQCTGEAVRLVYLLLSYHAVSSVLVKQEDLSTCCCRIMLCPVYW